MPTIPTPERLYVAAFPTARVEDVYIYLHVQTNSQGYQQPGYGTPLPQKFKEQYPDHRLVLATPNREVGDGWAIHVYANVRANQDTYNYDVTYAEGVTAFPTIERSYIYLRSDYALTGPLAVGTADPGKLPNGTPMFPSAILSEAEKMVEGTGDQTIDSLFVRVMRKFQHIPALSDSADLNAAKTFGYLVEYPYGLTAYPRVTWKIPCDDDATVTPLTGTCPIPGYNTSTFGTGSQALLAIEQSYKNDKGVVIALLRVFECNPGPLVVSSTYEPRTGTPVRITKQIVAASLIPADATALNAEINGYAAVTMTSIVAGTATTSSAHGMSVGRELYFIGMSSLTDVVNGTATGTGAYYVKTTPTSTTFTFALTPGGAAISTAAATGGSLNKRNLARGTTIEYNPMGMDGLRAIKVTSSIDVSRLDYLQGAPDTVYYGSQEYSFPDILTDAGWINAEAFVDGVSWDFRAIPDFVLKEGYKGPCLARITERYTSNPASAAFLAGLPAVTVIQGGFSTVGYAFWKVVNGRSIAIAQVFPVPNSIHGAITMSDGGRPADADGGAYISTIPATPTTATPNGWIVIKIVPEKWQFGLWVYRIIEIIHPS